MQPTTGLREEARIARYRPFGAVYGIAIKIIVDVSFCGSAEQEGYGNKGQQQADQTSFRFVPKAIIHTLTFLVVSFVYGDPVVLADESLGKSPQSHSVSLRTCCPAFALLKLNRDLFPSEL